MYSEVATMARSLWLVTETEMSKGMRMAETVHSFSVILCDQAKVGDIVFFLPSPQYFGNNAQKYNKNYKK